MLVKKKKSRKPASDFAKELDDLDLENDEDGAAEIEGDLGDDVFERANGTDGTGETGKEAWVLEGRDPTYPEVSLWDAAGQDRDRPERIRSYLHDSSPFSTLTTLNLPARSGGTPLCLHRSHEKAPRRLSLPT